MLNSFLNLMLLFLRSMVNPLFLLPLGFIVLCLVITLFYRMGGR